MNTSKRVHVFILLFLATITFLIFFQISGYDFLNIDDDMNVYKNPFLNPPTLHSTFYFWTNTYKNLYIPVTYTTWAIVSKLSLFFFSNKAASLLLDPFYFHALNIVIHIANILLVYSILNILLSTLLKQEHFLSLHSQSGFSIEWAACCGAFFFALHPLQIEPVAWVTGLKDVLSGFFSFLALWLYLLFIKNKYLLGHASLSNHSSSTSSFFFKTFKNPTYIAATIAFILALLTKPSAVVLPLIVFIFDYTILKKVLKETAIRIAPWILITVPIIFITSAAQEKSSVLFITPLWARPLVFLDSISFYLIKIFLPLKLNFDYGRSPETLINSGALYYTGLIPVLLLAAIYFFKNRSLWIISFAVFVIGFLPVSGLIPFHHQFLSTVADRYLYFSMLGPSFAAACIFATKKNLFRLFLGIFIAGLGVTAFFQSYHWKNTITLLRYSLTINPKSFLSNHNMGVALYGEGKIDEAIDYYFHALAIKKEFAETYYNLGVALTEKGRYSMAIPQLTKALEIKPNHANAHTYLGISFHEMGKSQKALSHFDRSLQINPNSADGHFNLGNTLARLGNLEKAVLHFKEALRLDPMYGEAYNNLGNTYMIQKKLPQAEKHYSKALQIDSNNAEAHYNLGTIYSKQGNNKKADYHFSEALNIAPDLLR